MSRPRAVPVDLTGKKMVVTGASPGSLGFETARALAEWGAAVVITTRSDPDATLAALTAALPSACRGAVAAHPLDLASAESVERFAAWYGEAHGPRLDALINNAGIHLDLTSSWKTPKLTADGVEIHYRTNYLGTAHLTQRLLPHLVKTGRESGDARIVNVASRLHEKGRNQWLFQPLSPYESWSAYGLSKLALMHMTFEQQRRHAADHVRSYCLHPGAVFTKIADRGIEDHPILSAARRLLAPIERRFLLSPEEGAQTQLHCATSPGLPGGLYYQDCKAVKPSPEAQDPAASRRLHEHTERWLAGLSARTSG